MGCVNLRQTIFSASFLHVFIAPSIRLGGRWLCNLWSLLGWSYIGSWQVWVYGQIPRIKVIGFLRLVDQSLLATLRSTVGHLLTDCRCTMGVAELWLCDVLIACSSSSISLDCVVRIIPIENNVRSSRVFSSGFDWEIVALLGHHRVILSV